MIGILVATSRILLLVVGLIGASIEVYAQLALELLQQLPGILQEQGGEATAGGSQGLLFDLAKVLRSLIENLLDTPLWLALTFFGIRLIYLGLYTMQRQVPKRRMESSEVVRAARASKRPRDSRFSAVK
jgi:hypothetical protein